ncbi:MAG: hypothetical protein HOC33_19595 [Alphaproteobacteria bacterium]|jgi:hypothetical protein|nr:hypothetical protein [Alphaproteobacteria bacterium]MBT4085053.1 hypothetical protein [Alphaproteobacteria bacterium]MBT4546067.1 hypothetical protein [Alphaproteobacteria bacterium]
MIYKRTVTDYETGEVYSIEIGNHITIAELANKLEVSRPVLAKAMLAASLLQKEYDDKADKPRNRLHPDAVKADLGFRIVAEHGPFDVLSPLGQELAEEALREHLASKSPKRWQHCFESLYAYCETREAEGMYSLSSRMKVAWLSDFYGDIPTDIISKGIGVSPSLVYKFLEQRKYQLEASERRRSLSQFLSST